MTAERKPRPIIYEGVEYRLLVLGGFGISRGLLSVVQAVSGPKEGTLYRADLDVDGLRLGCEIDESKVFGRDGDMLTTLTDEEKLQLAKLR